MIMDYHIHTEASPDARGTIEDYVKKAKEKGIDEIGFSDHVLLHEISGYPHVRLWQMPAYIKNFLVLRQKVGIPVKLGVEVDFFPEEGIESKSSFRNTLLIMLLGQFTLSAIGALTTHTKSMNT